MDRERIELSPHACKAHVLPLSLTAQTIICYIYIYMNKDRIPLNLRRRVIERDGYRCVYCDDDLTNAEVHLDHVIPESQGGPTSYVNLQVTCRKCNLQKGILTESVFEDKLRTRALNILNRLGHN